MRPNTLAEAVERIQAGSAQDVELAEFVDTFDTASTDDDRYASIAREPTITGDARLDALVGATTCTTAKPHVAYPTGGALAGLWEDTSVASPAQSTGHQLAVEAEHAAKHFGNTTTTLNRDAQYVIVSPTGTNPDNYQNLGFCAWHDYSGDSTLDGGGRATGPLLAFTNLPYIPDAGANCGAGFVNPGNNLDGVTIVEGHEYAETITDQFPAGGWTANNGEENGDLCAWLTTGLGRAQDITLTTGVFAVQGTWSNRANKGAGGCAIKNAIVT